MAHALINGDRRITITSWPLCDVAFEYVADVTNPNFQSGYAQLIGIDFSQSQGQIDAAIAQGLVDYLAGATSETFVVSDVRKI